MGEKEEVTTMVLKVDLQCHKCYKKVKKVLCKFPQIRDQTYDEKQNQVVIKVVCCNPEKIRDKICCKGEGAIKSIKIKEPEKSNSNPNQQNSDDKPECHDKPKCDCKPKCDDKPKCDGKPKCDCKPKCDDKPKCDGKPKCDCKPKCEGKPRDLVVLGCPPLVRACCMDCCQGHADGPCCSGCGSKKKDDCKPNDHVVPTCPPAVRTCCMDCRQGHAGGPCHSGYGRGPAPYIQYDVYYRRLVYDSYSGGNMGYCVTRPDCFSEENPSACTFM